MTLKERAKIIPLCLFAILLLTGALIFFTNTSGVTMLSILNGEDTFYFDWRDLFILSLFPTMVYFDVLVFLLLFYPLTLDLMSLWSGMINIILAYTVLAFLLSIPLTVAVLGYAIYNYESCGQKGPFSGVNYVKDIGMCEQFKYHPEEDDVDKNFIPITPADSKIK